MPDITEIEAMKQIDEALSALSDDAVRERVLRWSSDKHAPNAALAPRDQKPAKKTQGNRSKRSRTTMGVIKDLNLTPKSKKSFRDFAGETSPPSMLQKCAVAVYYLTHEVSVPAVSASHVLTCFKSVGWRLPADLPNTLQQAGTAGYLDTKKMDDIKITTIGENLVEHDLPKRAAK